MGQFYYTKVINEDQNPRTFSDAKLQPQQNSLSNCLLHDEHDEHNILDPESVTRYREIGGALMYLMISNTRPDLAFPVARLSKFCSI